MHLHRFLRLFLAGGLLLLLAGCVTGGFPGAGYPGQGYPDGYGGGYGQSQQVEGQVLDTDHRHGRFMLSDERNYRGQRVEVYYDQRTRLAFRGQQLAPQGLESGDVVRVWGSQSNRGFLASQIEVLRDVREGGYGQPGYGQPGYGQPGYGQSTVLEGALRYVDTRAQTLMLTRGGYTGPQDQVRYDNRTRFEDRGRLLRPDQLRNGDVLRVEARSQGGGWYADRVIVVQAAGVR